MLRLFLTVLSLVSVLGKSSLVCAHETRGSDCETLLERREWRSLSDYEKADYINAVECLHSQPAQQPVIDAARTRFGEFQALHINLTDQIHIVGQFLPWHRKFLRIYEDTLRTECGYEGAHPYWDWSIDADGSGPMLDSPIFDPDTGFGGNGVPGTYTLPPDPDGSGRLLYPASFVGCVADGPFASYRVQLGPGKFITDHCLVRGINDDNRQYLTTSAVKVTMDKPTFELFRVDLEGNITATKMHNGGHYTVGGEMTNFYSSPGDPLFYLHHANLDRIWWNWQQMDPSRLYEISGHTSLFPPYTNVTLDFGLKMGNFAPTTPIREVMDIHAGPLCYTYC